MLQNMTDSAESASHLILQNNAESNQLYLLFVTCEVTLSRVVTAVKSFLQNKLAHTLDEAPIKKQYYSLMPHRHKPLNFFLVSLACIHSNYLAVISTGSLHGKLRKRSISHIWRLLTPEWACPGNSNQVAQLLPKKDFIWDIETVTLCCFICDDGSWFVIFELFNVAVELWSTVIFLDKSAICFTMRACNENRGSLWSIAL